jgi:hypothetical protein
MIREIDEFPGYGIDTTGQPWSRKPLNGIGRLLDDWRKLKPCFNQGGYAFVGMMKNGKLHLRYVARLVLTVFVGPCPAGMQACHNDGVKTNNQLSNLRWDTSKGNHADKKHHGTRLFGEKHPRARLTDDTVRALLSDAKNGINKPALALKYEVSYNVVAKIIANKTWQHIARDFS